MVVTTSVLLASVCDRLMSRVVAFMARVRLEYHTPIWGGEGYGTLTGGVPPLPPSFPPPPHPPSQGSGFTLGLLTSRWPCRDFSRIRRV